MRTNIGLSAGLLAAAVLAVGTVPLKAQDQENEKARSSVRPGSFTSPARAGSLTSGKPAAGSMSLGKPKAGSMTIGKPSAGSLSSGKPRAGSATSGTGAGSLAEPIGVPLTAENLNSRSGRNNRTRDRLDDRSRDSDDDDSTRTRTRSTRGRR